MTLRIRYCTSLPVVLYCMVVTVDVANVSPRSDNRRQHEGGPNGGFPPGGGANGGYPPGELPPGGLPPGGLPDELPTTVTTPPPKGGGAHADKDRFTTPSTTQKRLARTTPFRITFEESCDYLAHYCLKAYNTGKVCGRTLYYTYHTFKNYCLLDYVNCMERYEAFFWDLYISLCFIFSMLIMRLNLKVLEVWQIVHMGECFNVTELTEYLLYPYDDDYFLDQYYVIEDH